MDQKTKEQELLTLMIGIYCKKKHRCKTLCDECTALLDYAKLRAEKCPFQETKTFCSNCKIHCYRPSEREKIRNVMKFAGPWMLIYNPPLAIKHVAETIKHKRKEQSNEST